MAELTRISAHGEKKLKLRRASLARTPSTGRVVDQPETNGHINGATEEAHNGATNTNGAEHSNGIERA